ncbi:MAG TPA: DUF3124 domain-containing protein, partial [Woeseiaceae bacterium]|nr:DUF3124 domain-containing protein [Woeseiaceae bacterium]
MRQVNLPGFFLVFGLMLSGCDNLAQTPSATPASDASFDHIGTFFRPVPDVVDGPTRLVYVPVYSRLFLSKASFWEMAASLSIRNTDPDQSLIVYQIEYIDTAGEVI